MYPLNKLGAYLNYGESVGVCETNLNVPVDAERYD